MYYKVRWGRGVSIGSPVSALLTTPNSQKIKNSQKQKGENMATTILAITYIILSVLMVPSVIQGAKDGEDSVSIICTCMFFLFLTTAYIFLGW